MYQLTSQQTVIRLYYNNKQRLSILLFAFILAWCCVKIMSFEAEGLLLPIVITISIEPSSTFFFFFTIAPFNTRLTFVIVKNLLEKINVFTGGEQPYVQKRQLEIIRIIFFAEDPLRLLLLPKINYNHSSSILFPHWPTRHSLHYGVAPTANHNIILFDITRSFVASPVAPARHSSMHFVVVAAFWANHTQQHNNDDKKYHSLFFIIIPQNPRRWPRRDSLHYGADYPTTATNNNIISILFDIISIRLHWFLVVVVFFVAPPGTHCIMPLSLPQRTTTTA